MSAGPPEGAQAEARLLSHLACALRTYIPSPSPSSVECSIVRLVPTLVVQFGFLLHIAAWLVSNRRTASSVGTAFIDLKNILC